MEARLKYGQLAPEGLAKMRELEHYLNNGTGLDVAARRCALCRKSAPPATINSLPRVRRLVSELQCWQGDGGVDVRRNANRLPAFCVRCSRRFGLAGVLNGVAAEQKMCRQAIAGS